MKQLLPLILVCALLCGCGGPATSEETAPVLPTESVAGEVSEPEAYGGTVRTIPLNLHKVQGLRIFGGNILLFSGYGTTTLTLLDTDTQEAYAALTLDFQLEQEDPSLIFHRNDTVSFFDPVSEETVVLGNRLEEVRRISAPGALSGKPILSDDGKTLYYCTASHVKAWDLESGIRRCVKEMAFDTQILEGVHMGSTVLQCRVTEKGQDQTLFLSAADGTLLHQGAGSFSLTSVSGRYFAQVPAGTYRISVFGSGTEPPRMLSPADLTAETFFLPEQMAAVTALLQEDDRVRLDYYSLSSGLLSLRLYLNRYQIPRAVACVDTDTLALLTYDPDEDRELLTLWDIRADSPLAVENNTHYTVPYRTADAPDTARLSQCQQQAAQLGQQYGINILLWEDAAATEPWDCNFTAEHLVPVLQQELVLLEQRLACYPPEVLAETAAHFSSMNLCLVRSLSHTAAGSTGPKGGVQFLDGTDAYVVIAVGTDGEQALYHQLFHLMETHIFSESNAFDRWDSLNPAGFQYDYDYAANAVRNSGVYLFQENRAFVDTFSMSYPREDRAQLMEYAMLPGQESLFRSQRMQEKLKQLCSGIREAYGLEDWAEDFLWEQYLE